MAYIYQIINDINNKVYIGKTEFSIEKRFKEHCRDAFKRLNENRPLYSAMRKYGIEHFHIELIEETSDPEKREIFWIQQKNSFKHGYNATMGGDGARAIDRTKVLEAWNKGLNCKQIALALNCDAGQIGSILKEDFKISEEDIFGRKFVSITKKVNRLDKDGKVLETYESLTAAAQDMVDKGFSHCKIGTGVSHIGEVCRGKRKTFSGFGWGFCE